MKLVAAIKQYLQMPKDHFITEYKSLTPKDKEDLKSYFVAEGIPIED
jgi:hypothetical protein